jgi:hypothetical protein
MTSTPVDFAVLVPGRPVHYDRRESGEAMHHAVRRYIPDLGTQGVGPLRVWFSDTFTRDMPDNRVSGLLIESFGYLRPGGWAGTVAVSMEEDDSGSIPRLSWEVLELIEEAAATPYWRLPLRGSEGFEL